MANGEVVSFNPFDYRAISFLEFKTQIENNPLFTGKPEWLKILLAGRLDIIASYIDARANDTIFPTMFTRKNTVAFAESIGYLPTSKSPASGIVQVTLKPGTSVPVTIPAAHLKFITAEAISGGPVFFTSDVAVEFDTLVQNINVIEGEIFIEDLPIILKGTAFEEFEIKRLNLIKKTISLVITANAYTEVDNLLESLSTDKHFRVIVNDLGQFIRGGDGELGERFPPNVSPTFTARYGGGTRGNVLAEKVIVYAGASTIIEAVINPGAMTGGQGEESIDHIKTYAPLGVVAQGRAVSEKDFLFFSETFGGVSKAFVEPNKFGVGSVKIQIVPNGGGSPSPVLKASLTALLTTESLLSNIFIEVTDPDYREIDVQLEVQTGAGVTFESVEDFVKLGVIFLINETTKELKEIRLAEGVESLITNINQLFIFNFDAVDPIVQKQITRILDVIDEQEFGKDVFINIFFTMADQIDGVDFIDLIEPSATVDILNVKEDANPNGFVELPTLGINLVTSKNLPQRTSTSTMTFSTSSEESITVNPFSGDVITFNSNADATVT